MLRGRSSSKLTTRLDSEGNLVEVESREDEEQNIKLQETVDLLLAAGYFRARIKGLSPFDKVVGGMTWCIEVCNFDIDVDLLFQENLTIGQKIALTEKIVSVLPKMKCPHRLEPHQIQGLDFIHIFPVVQWLVKRAIETREEMGDYIRSYSLSQFHKEHRTPEDEAFLETKENHRESMLYLQEIYKQQRQFKRHDSHILKDEETRVQSTLLEYGRHLSLRFSAKSQDSKKDVKNSQLLERQDSAEDSRLAAEHIKTLMSGMSATDDHEHKLTATAVGSIVGLQSAEIQQIASEYKDKQAEISSGDAGEKIGSIQQHKRIVASLTKQTEQQKAKQGEIEEKHSDVKKTYLDVQEKLQETKDYKNKIAEDMKIYDEMENNENKSVFNKLRTLVALNENLKNQELEFKTHCKEEMARLKSSIEELHSECAEDDSEDHERTQLIETQLHHDKEKLHKIRLLLARKNREIASLQRKIDEVPTRAELSQYQRRFVELYNQVAATHKETKQFYTLYNILDDTKMYLSKEVNLLNSILDNFTEAMSSVSTKEQFLKQFEQIVEGIKQNKIKLERKKQEEKMRRDRLNDTYLDLIEKQRLYFKTVKDFKEECRKNELLLAKLKGLGQ